MKHFAAFIGLLLLVQSAAAQQFTPPSGTVLPGTSFTATGGTSPQTLPNFAAGLGVSVMAYAQGVSINDGAQHSISGQFASYALAAAYAPSLNYIFGSATPVTASTHTSTTLDTISSMQYVVVGQKVSDADGDIPASTTVSAVNYNTSAVTLSQAATGSHAGDVVTFAQDLTQSNWQNVSMAWAAYDKARSYVLSLLKTFGSNAGAPYRIVFPQGSYYINEPLNATCISDANPTSSGGTQDGCGATAYSWGNFYISGTGATIRCHVSGGICFDGMGSRNIVPDRLTIIGSCGTDEPAYGFAYGRTVSGVGADQWTLFQPQTNGCFSTTTWYNLASETNTILTPLFYQADNNGNAYAGIADGGNQFQILSYYVSEQIAQNAYQSFNGLHIVGGAFYPYTGNSDGLFMYADRMARLDEVYIVNQNSSGSCINVYFDSSANESIEFQSNKLDVHCEGPYATAEILVEGTGTSPVLSNLIFADAAPEGGISGWTGSVFGHGGSATSVELINPQIDVAALPSTASLFDSSSVWSILGSYSGIRVPALTSGWVPSVSGGTGEGVGGSYQIQFGRNPALFSILINTGSSGTSATGAVNITMPTSWPNAGNCSFVLSNGGAAWATGSWITYSEPQSSPGEYAVAWQNGAGSGTALTTGTSYVIRATGCGGI